VTLNEIEFAIESRFERKVDRIDDAFCSGKMGKREYNAAMKAAAAAVESDWSEARKTWPALF
jgi:uncharacterized protein (DUF2164 family)